MDLPPLASILIVLFLIFANGFFVSAEFALVSVRATRIEQLAAAGSRTARLVLRAQADPNRFISAAQLGITVASLLLGWLGEETFARLFEGPLSLVVPHDAVWISSHGLASVLAIVLITFLHISIGEQVPKMLALQRSEPVIMFTTPPTDLVARVFRPFIAVLYGFTNVVLRLMRLEFRAEDHALHSPEELRLLVGRSARAGLLSPVERQLVERAFAFSDLTAGEVMVPRTEVVAISVDASMQNVVRTLRRYRHSRFPVYEGTIDNVIGVLSAKDLVGLRSVAQSQQTVQSAGLRRLLRPPVLVPESGEASEVLARMKAARQPLAVVLDEYGGTAGIVTLKNLVARLLGDVGDEYAPAAQELRRLTDGSVVADGLTLIEDVNEQLGTLFDASEVDTLGGLVFTKLGRRPRIGDEADLGSSYTARVESLDGLRIARVRLIKQASANNKSATA
jgi:putative hemolysin